jgi:hypothetical protein
MDVWPYRCRKVFWSDGQSTREMAPNGPQAGVVTQSDCLWLPLQSTNQDCFICCKRSLTHSNTHFTVHVNALPRLAIVMPLLHSTMVLKKENG